MKLICDSHEPKSVTVMLHDTYPQLQVAELGESSGDLFIQLETGIILIERKTPNDLVASIADSRLFEQAQTIPALCRFPYLVLDGTLYYSHSGFLKLTRANGFEETRWRKSSIDAALAKCWMLGMLDGNISHFARNGESYLDKVKSIIDFCEKADEPHIKRVSRYNNSFWQSSESIERQSKIEWIAALAPGIGAQRAKNLVDAFPNKSRIELLQWIAERGNGTKVELWGEGSFNVIIDEIGLKGKVLEVKPKPREEWKEAI